MYYLEIQGLFKDFCHNSRIFQGFMQIKDFSRQAVKLKGFPILYEPCQPVNSVVKEFDKAL